MKKKSSLPEIKTVFFHNRWQQYCFRRSVCDNKNTKQKKRQRAGNRLQDESEAASREAQGDPGGRRERAPPVKNHIPAKKRIKRAAWAAHSSTIGSKYLSMGRNLPLSFSSSLRELLR